MKVKADRHQKLISWAPNHILYSCEVWRRSDQIYPKKDGFVDLHDLPQSDLDLWPWPSKFCVLKGTRIGLWHTKLQDFASIAVLYRVIKACKIDDYKQTKKQKNKHTRWLTYLAKTSFWQDKKLDANLSHRLKVILPKSSDIDIVNDVSKSFQW